MALGGSKNGLMSMRQVPKLGFWVGHEKPLFPSFIGGNGFGIP